MVLTADEWDDKPKRKKEKKSKSTARKVSFDDFDSEPKNSGKIKALLALILVLVLLGVGAFFAKDKISGLVHSGKTAVARDPDAGSDRVDLNPPSSQGDLVKEINDYYSPSTGLSTTGILDFEGKKVRFATTWTADRSLGYGTITLGDKTAEVRLYKDFEDKNGEARRHGILVRNNTGILNDLVGKPVPFDQWVLINSTNDLAYAFPSAAMITAKADGSSPAKEENNVYTSGDLSVTKSGEVIKHIKTSKVDCDISKVPQTDVVPLPSGFALQGKIERTPDGSWKNLKYT